MKYQQMLIDDLRIAIDNKTTTPSVLFEEAKEMAKRCQEKTNAFVTIMDDFQSITADSLISGIPYGLKDNFSTKDILTTASSNILKDYVPVYDSTVYQKLKTAGAVLVGKTTLDELAMGGTGTTGHTGIVTNPWDSTRLIGGSSAGSAAAVAAGVVPFAIGSDTGDSVRKPAAFGGVVGFKPTYGRISRYGLFAFASSLDHVGLFTRSVRDVAIVTDVLKGQDSLDMTSLEDDKVVYADVLENDVKGKKLFYFKDICNASYYSEINDEQKQVLESFQRNLEKLRTLGFIIDEVDFDKDLLSAVYPTYMIISCAEATSNNANLTGISFGSRGAGDNIQDIMFDARTKGFSELIKRRFIIGSYILQKENQEKLFLNAGRVRRMIVEAMNDLFEKYDGLILPTSGGVAPKMGAMTDRLSEAYLILENHLAIGNFGGFPSITIPSDMVDNLPISINITGPIMKDAELLNMAFACEQVFGLKGLIVGGETHV